ncbi:MAG TPA: MarR family transcriptional regulator [Streptosporangiaceae bacterium]|nr:MarR family transcriptional regulator [Streptosporangiaceae bacterium]
MTTSGPRWLTADEQCTWRNAFAAWQWLFAAVDGQLQRDSGMPLAYYEILVQLSEVPDRALRMTQLAEASSSSKSRVSHAVARLEERGWVRRMDCPTDRRGQIAQLTEDGFAALSAAAPGHVEQVRRVLFDALSAEQLRQLAGIDAAILAAAASSAAAGDGCPEAGDSCPAAEEEQAQAAH